MGRLPGGGAGGGEPALPTPGRDVIAGDAAAVERAMQAAKARGAKRAVLLPVSVPAHSSLMLKAAERLRRRLQAPPCGRRPVT